MNHSQQDNDTILPLKELRVNPELINNMESISFCGKISVIYTEEDIVSAVELLSKKNVIGFDTESRPAFLKGQKFPVAVIQIAIEDEAFIFQLKRAGFHPAIKTLLSNPDIHKIGVGVHDDIKRLQDMSAFHPAGFVDLSCIAKSKGLIQTGLRALTARYLGKKLIKSSQKTNWSRTNLSERQLRYASTDAWICLKLLAPVQEDKTDYFALRQAEAEGE